MIVFGLGASRKESKKIHTFFNKEDGFVFNLESDLNDVSWNDSGLLVVLGGISSELENLSGEVFEDGGHVDWGTGSNSGGSSRVSEVSGNSSDWELKSSLG